jgi:hypothetical protein
MIDKRLSKRKIKRLPIAFLCGVEEHKGITSNFSYTGLFITVRKAFQPRSSMMKMVLELGENRKIALKGEIARVEEKSKFDRGNVGIGIKLNHTTQVYKEFVEALINEEW